jgi:hypothetical protein
MMRIELINGVTRRRTMGMFGTTACMVGHIVQPDNLRKSFSDYMV